MEDASTLESVNLETGAGPVQMDDLETEIMDVPLEPENGDGILKLEARAGQLKPENGAGQFEPENDAGQQPNLGLEDSESNGEQGSSSGGSPLIEINTPEDIVEQLTLMGVNFADVKCKYFNDKHGRLLKIGPITIRINDDPSKCTACKDGHKICSELEESDSSSDETGTEDETDMEFTSSGDDDSTDSQENDIISNENME